MSEVGPVRSSYRMVIEFPQGLKAVSFAVIYVRAKARTLPLLRRF